MPSTPTKPKFSPALQAMMDKTRDFIAGNKGSANVHQILVAVFHNQNPAPDHIKAAHHTLREDERFTITGEGAAAIVTVKGAEPETLDVQALAAGAATEERQEEPTPAAAEAPAVPESVPAQAETVPEASSAQDQTPAPADQAPNIDAQPGNEIIVEAAADLILAAIAANGGDLSEADIGKAVPNFKPEEIEAAGNSLFLSGLVEREGTESEVCLLVLTCQGWTEAMAIAKKKADDEIQKKNDELRALHKRVKLEQELAEVVKACEADVEGCKAAVAAAKESLATANKKLAAFIRGEVQASFLGDDSPTAPTGQVTAYEKGMQDWDPAKAEAVNPFRDDPQRSDWQRGYDDDDDQVGRNDDDA